MRVTWLIIYDVVLLLVFGLSIFTVTFGTYVTSPRAFRTTRTFTTFTTTAPTTSAPPPVTNTTTTTTSPSTTPAPTVPPIVVTCPPDRVGVLGDATITNPDLGPSQATGTGGCSSPLGIQAVSQTVSFTPPTTGFVKLEETVLSTAGSTTIVPGNNQTFLVLPSGIIYDAATLTTTGNQINFGTTASFACGFSAFAGASTVVYDKDTNRWLVAFGQDTTLCFVSLTVDTASIVNSVVYANLTQNFTAGQSIRLGLTDDMLAMTLQGWLCALNRTWPHNIILCSVPFGSYPLLPGFDASLPQLWTPLHALSSLSTPITGTVFFRHFDDELHVGATMTPTTDYIEVEHWTVVTPTLFNPVRYRIAVADFDSSLLVSNSSIVVVPVDRVSVQGCIYRPEQQSVTLALATGTIHTRWIELRWRPPTPLLGPRWTLYQQGTLFNATGTALSSDNRLSTFFSYTNPFTLDSLCAYRLDNDPLNTLQFVNTPLQIFPGSAGGPLTYYLNNQAVVVAATTSNNPNTFLVATGPTFNDFPFPSRLGVALIELQPRTYTRTWRAFDQCFAEAFCNKTLVAL